jgi:hypothetical protein
VPRMLRDSSNIVVDTIPRTWLQELRADGAFDYSDKRPPVNIMQELLNYLRQFLGLMESSDDVSWLIDLVMWTLIIGAVALIVWTLIKTGVIPPITLRSRRVRVRDEEIDDISELDFDRLIGTEVAAGRYRVAMRYRYLHVLRDLQDDGRITYKRDRTNRAYARDLSGTSLAAPFAECVRVFERVWYGEQHLTSEQYDAQVGVFDTMRRAMQGGEA